MELAADQHTGKHAERLMDVGTTFVTHSEATVLMQPGQAALDHPAVYTLFAGWSAIALCQHQARFCGAWGSAPWSAE